jgi:hypothetical protein
MPWNLGVVEGSSLSGWRFEIVHRLSDADVARYDEAVRVLSRFRPERHPFALVQLSYQEYQATVNAVADVFAAGPPQPHARKAFFDISAKLISWLSSTRRFLASAQTDVKQRYGRRSAEWSRVEAARQKEYVNNPSYRFTYKLRDYSDHCGQPPGRLHFSQRYDENDQPESVLQFLLDRDRLLQDYNRWEIVKKDLKRWPPEIEIGPHIQSTMGSLDNIMQELLKIEIPSMIAEAKFIQQLVAPVANKPGSIHVFRYESPFPPPGQQEPQVQLKRVPMELVEQMLRYQ